MYPVTESSVHFNRFIWRESMFREAGLIRQDKHLDNDTISL